MLKIILSPKRVSHNSQANDNNKISISLKTNVWTLNDIKIGQTKQISHVQNSKEALYNYEISKCTVKLSTFQKWKI